MATPKPKIFALITIAFLAGVLATLAGLFYIAFQPEDPAKIAPKKEQPIAESIPTGPRESAFVKADYLYTEWEDLTPEQRQMLRAEAFVLFPGLLAENPKWQKVANWLQDAHKVDVRRVPDAFNTLQVENLPPVYSTLLGDVEKVGDLFRTLKSEEIGKYWPVDQVSNKLYFRFEQWREIAEPFAQDFLGPAEGRNFMINIMVGVRQPAAGDPLALEPLHQ